MEYDSMPKSASLFPALLCACMYLPFKPRSPSLTLLTSFSLSIKALDKVVTMVDAEQLEEVTVMLPEDKIQEYREVFSFFDRDGGGTITSVELGQVMRTFGWNPSEGDLQV